jgi:hypothetical protein
LRVFTIFINQSPDGEENDLPYVWLTQRQTAQVFDFVYPNSIGFVELNPLEKSALSRSPPFLLYVPSGWGEPTIPQ